MTEWRRVASPYRAYEVSDDGRLRRQGRELACSLDRYGYRRAGLYYAGLRKHVKIHTVVCEAFHGPRPSEKHEVCHNDGDKLNNSAANLRWGTRFENVADSIRLGTFAQPAPSPGETHHAAKLTEDQVAELRSLAPTLSQRTLAGRFGISQTQVCHILQGRQWAHSWSADQ